MAPITLDAKIPEGPLAEKWETYKFDRKLVNPANRRKYEVIVVGTATIVTVGNVSFPIAVLAGIVEVPG